MATNDFEAVIFTANEQYPSLFESLSRLNEYMISQASKDTGLVSLQSHFPGFLDSKLISFKDHYSRGILLRTRLGWMGEPDEPGVLALRRIAYRYARKG